MNRIDFQLKATTQYEFRSDAIAYDLRVENYNQLVSADDLPRILILYLMPDDPTEWLSHSVEELCLRECAYWHSLMGSPISTNTSTNRVHVPASNLFHPDGLQDMFDQVWR